MNKFLSSLKQAVAVLVVIALLLPSAALAAEEIIDDDGNIKEKIFEQEWRKYSDFPPPGEDISADEDWPLQSRSWEVQQYYGRQDEIDNLKRESFALQAEMEFDRQMRLELREYRKNLVQNIRVNLLKSFWRLSFMTYDNIQKGATLGKSFAKLFTTAGYTTVMEGLSYMNEAVTVIEGLTPKEGESELVKATKDTLGNVLDVDKIITDPKQIAVVAANKLKGKADKFMPKADISDAEIEILRSQHLAREGIDEVLQESYRENIKRRDRVAEIALKIQELEKDKKNWELAEKERIREMLIADYNEKKASEIDCFIATAVYGSPEAGEIVVLREFRDEVMLPTWVGSKLIAMYYRFSPPLASYLTEHETARTVVREALVEPIVKYVQSNYDKLPSNNNAD